MLGRRITTIITHDTIYNESSYTRIKLCGMHRDEDIDVVNAVAPDFCGFVVNWPKSHHSVDRRKLKRLITRLDPAIPAVGVFVNQPLGYVAELADEVLDVVQLHGDEENPYITFLRELVDIPIIQTIFLSSQDDVYRANTSKADLIMVEPRTSTASEFDLKLLNQIERPYMFSGGLTSEDVAYAAKSSQPWGVNLNMQLETACVKDPDKIRQAVKSIRKIQKA